MLVSDRTAGLRFSLPSTAVLILVLVDVGLGPDGEGDSQPDEQS